MAARDEKVEALKIPQLDLEFARRGVCGVRVMQRFGGLLLLLMSTAALGTYLILPPQPDDDADLAEVTRISIAPYHPERTTNIVRTFTPASPAPAPAEKSGRNANTASHETPDPSVAWTTVVTADRSRAAVLRSSKPGDSATRYELARDLQRGLKRAGCYGGPITGVWSASTKQAMSVFLDRANATLPIKAPDFILLSLVQNHSEISCTADCPSGQSRDTAGRCVPSAVLAQTSTPPQQSETNPVSDVKSRNSQSRVAVVSERLPWLDHNGRSIVTPPQVPRAAPPPGMMSIGGPAVASAQPAASEHDNGAPLNGASGSVADPNTDVAALTSEDEVSDDAAPDTLEVAPAAKRSYTRHSRSWRDRPRRYGYAGKHRRGDPRPGTMRYNLVQALGGIY
ncbi:peptidoglycan-binding domain-containing protein [Hyphomicrobium sp.]|uniref:peptidoglycan-binding domain-containing protein n=1 Tax=Hyphomicrobium sp. TaxID=82 RepID=UPI002BF11C7B|nr:peptidoglycan-binding domain-containing protein [Hyphomicrobium sp.]HVZ05112.1 peptidoglycan-binding domain-containing protein [Hyphomicrobium sp.]